MTGGLTSSSQQSAGPAAAVPDEDALVARVIHTANQARASGAHNPAVARQGLMLLLGHLRAEGMSEQALAPLVRYITSLG